MKEPNYYIVDYGKETVELAQKVVNDIKDNGGHVVVYLTDLDHALMVQFVSEDEFLEHFRLIDENETDEN